MATSPSPQTRAAVVQRDGLWCRYCLRELVEVTGDAKRPHHLTIDHVRPLSRGGRRAELANLVVACQKCNQAKGNALLDEIGWVLFPPRYLEGRSLDDLTPDQRELRQRILQWSGKKSARALTARGLGPETEAFLREGAKATERAQRRRAAGVRRVEERETANRASLTQRPFGDLRAIMTPCAVDSRGWAGGHRYARSHKGERYCVWCGLVVASP